MGEIRDEHQASQMLKNLLSAPQPQTHCDAATSVMLSCPLPQQSAARTPQRQDSHSVPLPQQQAGMTPQRRNWILPSRTLTTRHHDVRNLSAGLAGWLAEDVLELASPVLSPRGPATTNHLVRHAVCNQGTRRRDASDAEIQSPRTWRPGRDTCLKVSSDHCRFWGRCSFIWALSQACSVPFKAWTPQKRNWTGRKQTTGDRTSRRPEPHPENTAPKVYFRGPTVEFFLTWLSIVAAIICTLSDYAQRVLRTRLYDP